MSPTERAAGRPEQADVVVVGPGWAGAPAQFAAWAGPYFRRRAVPAPVRPALREAS